jgi:nitroimidazol reductase NimA-like FMN-containing flavoprotein (pyridoxamine 5'-phosphate oxidase superfamily)
MPAGPSSRRSTVRRLPDLARYDRETVDAILDAGVVAHVAIVHEGAPVALPMAYARLGDAVYLHGSVASRLLRALGRGEPMCLTVTIVDGIVLARSAFNMSMNYRAVLVHGRARTVTDGAERLAAFRAVMDHLVPGHWGHVREPDDHELRRTMVVAVDLAEASAKVSEGPPDDDEADLALPFWGGELPLRIVPGMPRPDAHVPDGVEPPVSVRSYARRFEPAEVPGS